MTTHQTLCRLNIAGMESATYDFALLHGDTDNQSSVLDVQYSLDDGATWINPPWVTDKDA